MCCFPCGKYITIYRFRKAGKCISALQSDQLASPRPRNQALPKQNDRIRLHAFPLHLLYDKPCALAGHILSLVLVACPYRPDRRYFWESHVRPPFAKARTLFLADKYLEMKVLNVKQNMKVERQACITVRLRDYICGVSKHRNRTDMERDLMSSVQASPKYFSMCRRRNYLYLHAVSDLSRVFP